MGLVLAFLGVGALGVRMVLTSAWFTHTEISTVENLKKQTVAAGFEVKGLMVDGRIHTDRNELKRALGITRNNSIFSYDIASIQQRVSTLPWVKTAVVERRLPDTIYVKIVERVPVAIWQKDGKLALVDSEGNVLTQKNLQRFSGMLVVTGENAPRNAPYLTQIIAAEKDLAGRIEIARWIGDRRWDIKLKNGITLRLPEDDMELALKRLAEAQANDRVLDRMVETIDLRDPMRIVVQTAPGAAQKYDADYKREKNI